MPSQLGFGCLRSDLLSVELKVDSLKLDVHEFRRIILVFVDVKPPSDLEAWQAAIALVGSFVEDESSDDGSTGSQAPSSPAPAPAAESESDPAGPAGPADPAADPDDPYAGEMDPMEIDISSDSDSITDLEPDALHVDIPNFHAEKFGRRCPGLEALAAEIYGECCHGENRLFVGGRWRGWPAEATPDAVYAWLERFVGALAALHMARGGSHVPPEPRGLFRSTPAPVPDNEALPVTFKDTYDNTLLVVGLVHSDPAFDNRDDAWRPLNIHGLYKLSYVEDRRFIVGFTLCGTLMRVWSMSPVTGAASTQFDIHEDGERLVYTFLGFLLMDDKALGFF